MDPSYMDYSSGKPVPVYESGTPGAAGAISDLVKALAQAMAPKAITQRRQNVNGQVDSMSGDNAAQAGAATAPLGNQF